MAVKGFGGQAILSGTELKAVADTKLKTSGLSAKHVAQLGISFQTGEESAALELWGKNTHAALAIPYTNPWGDDWFGFTRYRCLENIVLPPDPTTGKVPRFAKYKQTKNTPPHAYFPTLDTVTWPEYLTDPSKPLIITEGELKAACATSRGFPTIGLGGVDSYQAKKLSIVFLPELEKITWKDRKVYIAFDSDIIDKPDVARALAMLAGLLTEREAIPYKVRFVANGDKIGLDDYLVCHKDAEFASLIADAEEIRSWSWRYVLGEKGPYNNYRNAEIAVTYAPEIMDCFAWDQLALAPVVVLPLPGEKEEGFEVRDRTDLDDQRIQSWLQGYGYLHSISTEVVCKAINARAASRPFHPVRDYIRSRPWDGVERIGSWLINYLGVKDCDYARGIGRQFLISMVARVEEPGCKADHALVLEGLQGIKKSTICNALAGDAWFSDNLPNIGGHQEKDAQQHTLGKWLIEIAELGAMKKADIEDVKKFISRRIEKFRPPYGRNEITAPRQCVFIGTTNADTYLTDDTGNRRFWPVLMTRADIEGLRRDSQQFFAEALVAYQAGEKWWPDDEFEKKFIKPEQDLRFVGDPWEEQIDYYVRKEMGKNAQYRVTTNNVASMGLGVTPDKMNTGISRRIAAALKRLGWWQMKSGNNTFFLPPVALVEEMRGEAEAKVVPIPKSRKPKKY